MAESIKFVSSNHVQNLTNIQSDLARAHNDLRADLDRAHNDLKPWP